LAAATAVIVVAKIVVVDDDDDDDDDEDLFKAKTRISLTLNNQNKEHIYKYRRQ